MSPLYQRAKFLPAGDTALSVELGDSISMEANQKVRDLSLAIQKQNIRGVLDLIPTYRSILVYYDPLRVSPIALQARLASLEQHLGQTTAAAPKVVELPTVYGGEYGPDLEFVARYNGLTAAEAIRIHSATDYLVYMLGFTPGFPYLGGMSETIATPRLATPRAVIPAGSVGIAERQTGVYPVESPGGWRLIGRTPVQLFRPTREPPVLVEPGDYVRFVSITAEVYRDIQRQIQAGRYQVAARVLT